MKTKTVSVLWIVEEFEHGWNSRIIPHPPKAFTDPDVAEKYIRERALSYSEDCLMAYDSMEATLEDPTEASFELTPVALNSKEVPDWDGKQWVLYVDDDVEDEPIPGYRVNIEVAIKNADGTETRLL